MMARVLVVESERYLRSILSAWLERSGHGVIAVADIDAANQALASFRPDVLIADARVPRLEEVHWTQDVLAADPALIVAFVLVSVSNARDLMDAVEDPRVHVLPKPFSPTRLLEKLNRAVSHSAAPRRPALRLVAGGAA